MELLNPTRITSLESYTIRVIHHNSPTSQSEFVLRNVYPFETLFHLKQRIALHYGEKEGRTYLPSNVLLAQEAPGGFRTLEFYWSELGKVLPNPFTNPGKADTRIYENGARKGSVFPTILTGISVESALASTGSNQTIHMWSLKTLLEVAGFGALTPLKEDAFHGYFSLYFPLLATPEEVVAIYKPMGEPEKEAFRIAQEYRTAMDARLAKVESGLVAPSVRSAANPQIRELRLLRYNLPKNPLYTTSVLELKFYEIAPSATMPFIRFFPFQDKIAPLIKLAKGATGVPLINDPKLLDLFMMDEPPTKEGSVMIIKTPIKSGAPFGTCWTLRIFEDGTADLKIGAPRKDAPLSLSHVNAAFEVLPELLTEAGWSADASLTLADMTATYLYKTRAEEKPTKAELKARLDAFLPFFYEEKVPEGSRATLALRYRAVSNFDEDENPYLNHLSMLFLRESNASTASLSREAYMASLMKHFGLSSSDASAVLDEWTAKRAEYILEDRETAIASLQLGSAITIGTSNYPNYAFFVSSVESFKDLQRILSLLSVFATLPSQQLRQASEGAEERKEAEEIVEAVESAIPPAGPVSESSPYVPDATLSQFDDFGDFGGFDSAVPVAEEEPAAAAGAAAAAAAVEIEKDVELPDLLGKDEMVGSVSDKWYLDRLVGADKDLFAYSVPKGDVRSKTYSVSCQKSSNKQPFVMTPENYAHARALYGNDVSWVEAPLDPYDLMAATLVSKTVKQRKGVSAEEIYDYEIRALQLGFPLKGDESATLTDGDAPSDKKALVRELMEAQKTKPLWTIVRAGTNPDHPNYYICATLWCIRDELPLIPAEFQGETLRRGGKKPKNSCAFCGGKLIQDRENPKIGETVLERGASAKTTSKVAQYVGFPKDLVHPDGYPTPCCFVDPDNLKVPDGAKPIPAPVVALPEPQQVVAAAPAAPEPAGAAATESAAGPVEEVATATAVAVADENRDRPFSQTTLRTGAQNKWYIPNQNIVGRTATEWYELGKGDAGVPPPSVNTLLGQNPTTFLTATKGALGVSINSYLKAPGNAFVRYGLGSSGFLGLVAFAQYACSSLVRNGSDALMIGTPEDTYEMLFEEKETLMVRAFEQANYGTLIHEFGVGKRPIEEVKFQTWCGKIGIKLVPAQRAYAEQLYNAWLNFKDYVGNPAIPKDLRLFEGLLATPRLMTETGCILVRIKVPKKADEPATIECPAFGVSLKDYFQKPPLLFVVEDETTGDMDPLVFFDSTSDTDKRLYGVIQHETPAFGKISDDARTALTDFIQQYYNPISGCGRKVAPVHPWSPVLETSGLPRLRDFVRRVDNVAGGAGGDFGLRLLSLLRDRSNRLVGAIVGIKKNRAVGDFYIPLMDDGTILAGLTSIHGEEALPKPELGVLLDLLMGSRYPPADGKLASDLNFPGLLPVKLVNDKRNYVALILRSGAYVPFKPFAIDSDLRHSRFTEMKQQGAVIDIEVGEGEMPWDTDITLLGPTPTDAETLQTTSEEVMNEAYQHLRLSFSNWLNLTPAGAKVKAQIELLRRARHRLPLWELQKRLDVLLTPIVSNSAKPWITTEGSSTTSLLRRDCIQIRKKDDCTGGCTWSPAGRCLIHTTATPRYIDPVRVMTARLVDELLRTFGQAQEILDKHVAYLKPLPKDAIVKEGDSLLFSAVGRGSDPLFKRLGYMGRKPTQFSAGLTYPEEVDIVPAEKESVFNLPASWTSVFRTAVFGADVSRDALARRTAAIMSIVRSHGGASGEDVSTRLRGIPFDGSPLFWREFAKSYDLEVLTTSYDSLEKVTKLEGWYAGVPKKGREAQRFVKHYIVLDVEGIPLQRIDNGSFISLEEQLPATIRLWLESNIPVEKPIVAPQQPIPVPPVGDGGVLETKEDDEAPAPPVLPPPAPVPPQVNRRGNPCPPDKIFNPDSKRLDTDCVLRTGKKGKELLAAQAAQATQTAVEAVVEAPEELVPAEPPAESTNAPPIVLRKAVPPAEKQKLPRCPPGTHRNKKTGNCEPKA